MLPIQTPMRPNRPHIPSFIINVKERASRSRPPKRLISFCLFRSAVSASAFSSSREAVSSGGSKRLQELFSTFLEKTSHGLAEPIETINAARDLRRIWE
jgi:hypothetical protein